MRGGRREALTSLLRSRRMVVFYVFAAAYFLSQFYRSANAVIARDLVQEFSLDAAQLGLMTSLFYAAFALAQLPLGSALDRFGARVVTPTLMLAAAAGSLLFAGAHSYGHLAAGRALIGVGMAGVYMGGLKAFSQWFGIRSFAMASTSLVACGAVGALAAATPLAWLAGTVGWRSVFAWGSVAVVASAVVVAVWTRDAPPGVIWRPRRATEGFGRIFRSIDFWRIALFDLALVGTFLSVQGLWGGPFLFDVLDFSLVETGNVLTQLSAAAILGYLVAGLLSQRFAKQRVLVAAGVVFAASQALLVVVAIGYAPDLVHLAYPLFGFVAAFNPLLMAHVRSVFPTAMTGRAVTAVNLFGMGGAGLIQWAMGVIIGSFTRDTLGHYPPEAYVAAFGATTALCVAAVLFYAPSARRPVA